MFNAPQIDTLAANIAAELYHAANLAKQVSLTAKNARAISLRAGDRSTGFKAITVFINEFSEKTIKQANTINEQAIHISKLSIDHKTVQSAIEKFEIAWQFAGENSQRDDLCPIISALKDNTHQMHEKMCKLLRQLKNELNESEMQMRAAGIIATTSKTEASRAGQYRESLDAIASNIESSASCISKHLKMASQYLNNMEVMTV